MSPRCALTFQNQMTCFLSYSATTSNDNISLEVARCQTLALTVVSYQICCFTLKYGPLSLQMYSSVFSATTSLEVIRICQIPHAYLTCNMARNSTFKLPTRA